MKAQGYSLGRQLAAFMPPLAALAAAHPGRVWFLGRDMDVFHVALTEAGYEVRYLSGLDRETSSKLAHRGLLERWLRSVGVRDGDLLVDSGYKGRIYRRIERYTQLRLDMYLLTAAPDGVREAGVALDPAVNTPVLRHAILALEHSPKREVVTWDAERRRPRVTRLGGAEGERAHRFLRGCVAALREALAALPAPRRS